MKFLRYGPMGQEKPGVLDSKGRIRDLSGLIDDITPETIAAGRLEAIRSSVNIRSLPVVRKKPRIGSCIARTGNFIAIGLNYADHRDRCRHPQRAHHLQQGPILPVRAF
jgi:2-keto-4-pentenoate hydratase/2-oxohepta-3-ene-1,7-dioic acid hydratase in catechol pathway